MQLNNWRIFDKVGSLLNWTPDPYINLIFKSASGKNASGYLVTGVDGSISSSVISNSGFDYNNDTSIYYNYAFGENEIDITTDVSISYIDVSIFNPNPTNSQGIEKLYNIDVSTLFLYPSTTFAGAVFLKPVSIGLIETEHLYIFEEYDNILKRPFDINGSKILITVENGDDAIKLFTIDEDANTIIWTESLEFELNVDVINQPIPINIGFTSKEEGVFERKVRIYNVVDGARYVMAEIVVNAESIGEDERFRDILGNFGLPDPKDFPLLFKEADINEDLVDYQIINPKSKQMIVDQNDIVPYIGTYKALINALKWLGYDDIFIREWFKNVKNDEKLSLVVPFKAKDRSDTILKFSPEERKVLKKLNQLSLNYFITKETGEIDDWGTPQTKNVFEYNINEVFIKLYSLKTWLEKNIIGVNSRIIDIIGEGVYYERYLNLIYSTGNDGFNYNGYESVTPLTKPNRTELINSEASINMTLLEFEQSRIEDLDYNFGNFVDYIWDPVDPSVTLSINDPSYLSNPNNYLEVGPPLSHPFVSLEEIQWTAKNSKPYSGVLDRAHTSNPLWIYDNTLRFYNIFDTNIVFNDVSSNLSLLLEKAYLRDTSNDIWEDSIAFSIYPNKFIDIDSSSHKIFTKDASYSIISGSGVIYNNDTSVNYDVEFDPYFFIVNKYTGPIEIISDTSTKIESSFVTGYIAESSTGAIINFDDYVLLRPDTSSLLQYAIDSNYNVPLLSFKNYKTLDSSGNTHNLGNKLYHLDILDGKISMDNNDSPKLNSYINFNYDTSIGEQEIRLNLEYQSPRMPLCVVDPSIYYWADPSGLTGNNDPSILAIDNSIYALKVNHIGDYVIEANTWDGYNILYTNKMNKDHVVYIQSPIIYSLLDNSCNYSPIDCVSSYLSPSDTSILVNNNLYPIFDNDIPLYGMTVDQDENGDIFIKLPSITYFQETPIPGSYNDIYNLTERVLVRNNNNTITVDKDYQDFKINDNISVILFDKGKHSYLDKYDVIITNISNNVYTLNNNLPSSFIIDNSTSMFIINTELRDTSDSINIDNNHYQVDIQNYIFRDNQMVAFIITDNVYGYEWGSSFRVSGDPSGNIHTFDRIMPQFVIDGSSRYTIQAKHAFTTYAEMNIRTISAKEVNNHFHIYLDDDYKQLLLDDTFVLINSDFDQEKVLSQWYDSSININSNYYYYDKAISIDSSTLVILQAQFEPSTYLENQKNIWKINQSIDNDLEMIVFNDAVPYRFYDQGYHDILVESYDKHGNLSTKDFPGLINVK